MQSNQDIRESIIDAVNTSAVIAIVNQKFAEVHDHPEKAEVLSELLNELKLYLMPLENQEIH